MPQQPAQGQVYKFPPISANLDGLSKMKPDEKKNFVGNNIYQSINAVLGDLAGKITGMLLEAASINIEQLLRDPAYLNEKASEAYNLLITNGHVQPQHQQMVALQQQQAAAQASQATATNGQTPGATAQPEH